MYVTEIFVLVTLTIQYMYYVTEIFVLVSSTNYTVYLYYELKYIMVYHHVEL